MANENLVKRLRKEVMTLEDVAKYLRCDKEKAKVALKDLQQIFVVHRQNDGYYIRLSDNEDAKYIISPPSNRTQHIKMLIASDFHAGCRQFDAEGLDGILKKAVRDGYEHAYFGGDLHDGLNVYKGQHNNLVAWRLEDQVHILKDVLDKHQLHYRSIGGNHDYSWEEQGSINPVKLLSQVTSQKFEFLGTTRADVLVAGVAMRLVHGAGGNAYSLSYPAQVYLRNVLGQGGLEIMFDGEPFKLGILVMGHYHTKVHLTEYGVEVMQPGSFQKPNDFTERRGLRGPRGAYFVDFEVKRGTLLDFCARYVYVGSNKKN